MEEYGRPQPFMPMIPRLDRLDSLMKYLEGKYNLPESHFSGSKWKDDPFEVQYKPLASAIRDAQIHGSLMDRIFMLENRLYQLSLETEASSTWSSSTIHGSSSQRRRDMLSNQSFNGGNVRHRDESERRFHEIQPCLPDCQVKPREVKANDSTQIKQLIAKAMVGDRCEHCKKRTKHQWRKKRWFGC